MKRSKKKEITLDDLASMIAEGFLGVEERIGRLDVRVSNLENEMATKNELKEVVSRLDRIETNHIRRLEIVEDRVITLKSVVEGGLKTKIV